VFAAFSSTTAVVVAIRSRRRRDASSSLPSITQALIRRRIDFVLSSVPLSLLAGSSPRLSVRE